jgi:tRNA nucleotidyltransferase (CCA-adding enzyme)
LRWSALLHDIGAPTKRFIKTNKLFTVEFWREMAKKIFEEHMPKPKDEKNGNDESRPIVLSQDMVTDSAVRRLVFLMLVKMLKTNNVMLRHND